MVETKGKAFTKPFITVLKQENYYAKAEPLLQIGEVNIINPVLI